MRVGLFVTCLVDAMRPSIGFAALELLEQAGCQVHVPQSQTCCGQPAWNSGDQASALPLAIKWLKEFEQFDYVVVPSGSCAGMVKVHYLQLLENDPDLKGRAVALARKTYEFTDFLVSVVGVDRLQLNKSQSIDSVTYHDSCSGLRELGVHAQPRQLMSQLQGLQFVEMKDSKQCCGFGGTFSVKFGEVSSAICNDKCQQAVATGAQALVLGDLGCMLNIKGKMQAEHINMQVLHIAELLAGKSEQTLR